MGSKKGFIGSILICAALFLFIYTFFHEGGHALIAMLYGGKITEFTLGLNAHVNYQGANFSRFGWALCSAAGVLLPLGVGAIAISFYRSNARSAFYHTFHLMISVSLSFSLLPWLFIPVISLFTSPPPGDDVTHFLQAAALHPLLVSLGALLLISAFAFLIFKKGLPAKIKEISLWLNQKKTA